MTEEIINVIFEEKSIKITKNSNFMELKQKIFYRDNELIKYFLFEEKKIDENLRVANFPKFTMVMDQGKFQEFAKGKFRCKKCRKYVKISKMICNHSSKCKLFYGFKLKETMSTKIQAEYK